ncbi:MAG TPA: molybdenum cofactor biosynthesis protein MoaE [Candidatus Binatia bacterium]|nr:molybdenum cofactor biosynthesis protein MoaE [Candidatus Binatia bacterium]
MASAPLIKLSRERIDCAALAEKIRTDACGAVITFAGVVRELSDDERAVNGLSYETYPAMALEEMRKIAAEAQEQFGPCEIAIVHRFGDLAIGETSVAVVVAAPHRGPAFDACEYAIDELKARVEIWKKEHYLDGDATWRENAKSR